MPSRGESVRPSAASATADQRGAASAPPSRVTDRAATSVREPQPLAAAARSAQRGGDEARARTRPRRRSGPTRRTRSRRYDDPLGRAASTAIAPSEPQGDHGDRGTSSASRASASSGECRSGCTRIASVGVRQEHVAVRELLEHRGIPATGGSQPTSANTRLPAARAFASQSFGHGPTCAATARAAGGAGDQLVRGQWWLGPVGDQGPVAVVREGNGDRRRPALDLPGEAEVDALRGEVVAEAVAAVVPAEHGGQRGAQAEPAAARPRSWLCRPGSGPARRPRPRCPGRGGSGSREDEVVEQQSRHDDVSAFGHPELLVRRLTQTCADSVGRFGKVCKSRSSK